jgi:predicted ATPase/class 3 adenylate cyclase
MVEVPASGTVSLLFTDIDGSTRLLEELGDEYATLLGDHHRIMDAIVAGHGGTRIDAAGDGLFISFPTARAALLACIDAQGALMAHTWPRGATVAVRMGLHTGEPLSATTGYVGIDVHRAARICAAGHGGQILVSDSARALIGSAVPDGVDFRDLGEHRLKDLASAVRIYQVLAPGLPSDFPPIRSLETLPNNLPHQLSTFVGRSAEIVDAEEQLRSTALLTLTGPGGVGKTRLALELGAHVVDEYPGGVWFVEFSSLDDPLLVPDTVATTLRLKPAGGGPLAALVSHLADQRALVIFDNCEHLLDAVVDVADTVLRQCPDVRIVTTSREALGMAGERLMPVPSMSLPEAIGGGKGQTLEQLSACDAVRLFVERARSVDPAFRLTESNADAVAQICRRLDGIPLAVELAAARVRSLPPAQIASRLDHRFRLLTGGSRTALPRHRTLRAAMDWSFDLLPEDERILLPRLSAFAGSFSLDAAEAVASGGPVDAEEMIDLLAHLIDRSLLMPEPTSHEARYRMLETIRDYAQERLVESNEASDIYARHRDWYAALVEQSRQGFFSGAEQASWLTKLSDDHDNLRAALQWSHEDPDGASAELNMASGLWRFWEIRGHLAEGSTWLERALARTGGEVSLRRANALTGAGVLASHRGDNAAATAFHEASLLIHRELGDPRGLSAACNNTASIAMELGDVDRARALFREAIALAEAAGDPQGAGFTMVNLADLLSRLEEAEEADALYARALDTFRSLGDQWGTAQATARLAHIARRRGDPALAESRYEEARALYGRIADGRGEARMLIGLGDLAADTGDVGRAATRYREALALRYRLGDRAGTAGTFERLAGIATAEPARAAQLIGAASALRESVDSPLSRRAAEELEAFLADLEKGIGREAVNAALRAGRAMALGEAVAFALG